MKQEALNLNKNTGINSIIPNFFQQSKTTNYEHSTNKKKQTTLKSN